MLVVRRAVAGVMIVACRGVAGIRGVAGMRGVVMRPRLRVMMAVMLCRLAIVVVVVMHHGRYSQ